MRIVIDRPPGNAIDISRRLGYAFQKHINGEMAFIRPLSRSGFPRFHIYTKTESGALILNIHLDQHKETYGKDTTHHGEYGSDGAMKEEIDRIKRILNI